jgi:ATP-dependent DNA ligase
MDRKSILTNVLCPTENVSATKWVDDGVALFDLMKQNSLEGVVGKEKTGLYHENKREWKKVKCWQEGTFVAVGYTPGTGWRASTFGALVLADTNGNYVGEVGTGFTEGDIRKLFATFKTYPGLQGMGGKNWKMAPKQTTYIMSFPVKVKYLEFSNEGILRFPVFKGVV